MTEERSGVRKPTAEEKLAVAKSIGMPRMREEDIHRDLDSAALRTIARTYYGLEKLVVQMANRGESLNRREYETEAEWFMLNLSSPVEGLKNDFKEVLGFNGEKHPVFTEWAKDVKGLSASRIGILTAEIGDIGKFERVSNLWSYAMGTLWDVDAKTGKRWFPTKEAAELVVDGQISRKRANKEFWKKKYPKKEEKTDRDTLWKDIVIGAGHETKRIAVRQRAGWLGTWNPELRREMYLVEQDVIRQAGVYYEAYIQRKSSYILKLVGSGFTEKKKGSGILMTGPKGEETRGRIDNLAKRWLGKLILQHLWVVWRTAEGLPVTKPYALEYIEGHTQYIAPLRDK